MAATHPLWVHLNQTVPQDANLRRPLFWSCPRSAKLQACALAQVLHRLRSGKQESKQNFPTRPEARRCGAAASPTGKAASGVARAAPPVGGSPAPRHPPLPGESESGRAWPGGAGGPRAGPSAGSRGASAKAAGPAAAGPCPAPSSPRCHHRPLPRARPAPRIPVPAATGAATHRPPGSPRQRPGREGTGRARTRPPPRREGLSTGRTTASAEGPNSSRLPLPQNK